MGFPVLWPPTRLGTILQLPWPNSHSLGKLLACGSGKPSEGTDKVGLDGEDLGMGRQKDAVVGGIFQDSGTSGSDIGVRDMGYDPPHGPVPGGFPA